MNLAPSKALSHVKDFLQKMQASSEMYGLPPTQLFYTDNAAIEEPFIKNICPAIRANSEKAWLFSSLPPAGESSSSSSAVASGAALLASSPSSSPAGVAVASSPLAASLQPLSLPLPWKDNVHYAHTAVEINTYADLVLKDAEAIKDKDHHIVIGLDAEWTSHFENADRKPGKVAVIQWAYKDHITIAHVTFLLSRSITKKNYLLTSCLVVGEPHESLAAAAA